MNKNKPAGIDLPSVGTIPDERSPGPFQSISCRFALKGGSFYVLWYKLPLREYVRTTHF
jgi:hypothetical protein